jgi:hypothetical protein
MHTWTLRRYVGIVLYTARSELLAHSSDLMSQLLNTSRSLGALDTLGHTLFPLLDGL